MKNLISVKVGQKFNKFTVIKEVERKKHGRLSRRMFKCKCQCGVVKLVGLSELRSGNTKSCGCLNRSLYGKNLNKKTHGLAKHPLYKRWVGMKNRCLCPTSPHFSSYGGRGITVCKKWENSFVEFYKWATANGFRKDLQLDRINVNGNYSPRNCRWVTRTVNVRNRRNTVFISIGRGNVITLKHVCLLFKIEYNRAISKIRRLQSTNKIELNLESKAKKYKLV